MTNVKERPVVVEAFMDYHCPYSRRAVTWLDDLPAGLVDARYRFFALEQVNHDPDAASWRLWEQPLDYVHYRERQDRRGLAAFLATAILEEQVTADVVRAFRRNVYAERFDAKADIADLDVLHRAAEAAGAPAGALAAWFADPALAARARARIAADWAAGRSPWRVFGVPTLRFGDDCPLYIRFAGLVPAADGPALLDALLAFRAAAPGILEVKLPERASPGA